MKNPLKGMIVWPIPESKEVIVTIFKDPRTGEYEDKDWNIALEDMSTGKPRPLANGTVNIKDFACDVPTQTSSEIKLKPVSKKIVSASVKFSVSSCFIREGKATDEDMQSLASLMSSTHNDIAPLDELEADEDGDKSLNVPSLDQRKLSQVSDIASQIDSLINNLHDPNEGGQHWAPSNHSKSENSIDNSVLEDLPEDKKPQVESSSSSKVESHVDVEEDSQVPDLPTVAVASNSFVFGNMNLSKISEKTELNDTVTTPTTEKSLSLSFGASNIESKSVINSVSEVDGPIRSPFIQSGNWGRKGSPTRSVLGLIFGCFFPMYRFGL